MSGKKLFAFIINLFNEYLIALLTHTMYYGTFIVWVMHLCSLISQKISIASEQATSVLCSTKFIDILGKFAQHVG